MTETMVMPGCVQQKLFVVGQERQDGKHDHPDATQGNGCRAVLTFFQHTLIVSLGYGSRRRSFLTLLARSKLQIGEEMLSKFSRFRRPQQQLVDNRGERVTIVR